MKRPHLLGKALLAGLPGLVCAASGIGWGLPTPYDAAPDALPPLRSLLSVQTWPGGELPADKYPEAHHLLAGLVEKACLEQCLDAAEQEQVRAVELRVRARAGEPGFQAARALLEEGSDAAPAFGKLLLAGRLTTLFLLLLVSVATTFVAAQIFGPRMAWTAGLFVALLPAVVHYGATLNTDLPALAWGTLAWALALCAARRGGFGAIAAALGCGAAAGLCAATKDPLAALMVGVVLLALRRGAGPTRLQRVPWILLGGGITYVATSGLLHPGTWGQHWAFAFGEGSQGYRKFGFTLDGIGGMLGESARKLYAASGHLLFASGLGLLLLLWPPSTWWKNGRRRVRLLLPALTYVVLFLLPVGYAYPRFLLPLSVPVAILAALPALRCARAFKRLPAGFSWRRVLFGMALLVPGLLVIADALTVVQAKRADPRRELLAQLATLRAARGDSQQEEVWLAPQPWFLAPSPPPGPRRWVTLPEIAPRLEEGAARPRYLVVALPADQELANDAALAAAATGLGYRLLFTRAPPRGSAFLADPDGLILPYVALLEDARR